MPGAPCRVISRRVGGSPARLGSVRAAGIEYAPQDTDPACRQIVRKGADRDVRGLTAHNELPIRARR
jgi:hypothetical protein